MLGEINVRKFSSRISESCKAGDKYAETREPTSLCRPNGGPATSAILQTAEAKLHKAFRARGNSLVHSALCIHRGR